MSMMISTQLIAGKKVVVTTSDLEQWNAVSRLVRAGVARVEDLYREKNKPTIMTVVWNEEA